MITGRSWDCHNSRGFKEMVRVPDGNPWRRDKGRDPYDCFKLNNRVENMDLVLTVSQKNRNQLTVTRLRG